MKIAGLQKQSFIDYPGHISAVIFTQGCNLRCGYCHNSALVPTKNYGTLYQTKTVLQYLYRYQHLLDAVCITGGEPTLHKDLPDFIQQIKAMGLKVKLDTNGTNPKQLSELLDANLVDFIAMDVKHRLRYASYQSSVGDSLTLPMFDALKTSINLIRDSGIPHEFRTTVVKGMHDIGAIQDINQQCRPHYRLQNVNPTAVLDPEMGIESFSTEEFESLCFAIDRV